MDEKRIKVLAKQIKMCAVFDCVSEEVAPMMRRIGNKLPSNTLIEAVVRIDTLINDVRYINHSSSINDILHECGSFIRETGVPYPITLYELVSISERINKLQDKLDKSLNYSKKLYNELNELKKKKTKKKK